MPTTEKASIQVRIVRLREGVALPRYMTAQSAGLDLAAAIDDEVTLRPGQRRLVGTGLALELPEGYEAQVRPRSGLALRHGVTCLNSPGTIDADYRGEVQVLLVNHGDEPFTVRSGDRVAQLVVAPVSRAGLVEVSSVDALEATSRGAGGYGHTGVASETRSAGEGSAVSPEPASARGGAPR